MSEIESAAPAQIDRWDPLILTVAPNGARKTKADHPALPLTSVEIAECAAACAEVGAAMLHLHVRDSQAGHTLDADTYRDAIAAVRQAVGNNIVIQVTSEAVGIYEPQQQMAMVRDLRPESVSLAMREIVPDAVHEKSAAEFFTWMRVEAVQPQFIVYSADDLNRLDDLIARGIVPPGRHFVLFVLGRYSPGQVSEPSDLIPFLNANTLMHPWAVCAFGAREAACAAAATALGGHVRVGFENNMLLADGSRAPDNTALVTAAAASAEAIGRPVAGPGTARELLTGYGWS